MYAAKGGHSDIMNALLQRPDIDINSVDEGGWSALIHAANVGYSDIVNALLQRSDTDINQQDHRGWTPLTRAVDEGHAEIVRMLLSHKDIDIPASGVCVPEFWDTSSWDWDSDHWDWDRTAKHMTLPDDLIAQLRPNPYWLTDLEIDIFSGNSFLTSGVTIAEVDGEEIVDT
jgi:ankyrin repeat protein